MLVNRDRREERTGFQESGAYHPSYDLQTDFVMVYGIDDTLEERIEHWRSQDYVVHLMTGVSWGQYQDYLYGKYDGRDHWDEAQVNREGKRIQHGKDVPYMVPTIAFADYLTEKIKLAVDAGVEAIHLEEPEFWVRGGYSEAFKREWEIYYKEPWQPPHQSCDAQYRASRLKAYLYARCLSRLCDKMKEYAKVTYGRDLRFYVPTHSLINYTQWNIVSPESRLIDLPTVDGYIAQIWTGTSRTRNVYQGEKKERTFETAFLEYGIMQELVRGTDRQMWFLHDPIEDNPRYTWKDYRYNYLQTVVASLFHPKIANYEICPWPRRVFQGTYPKESGVGKERIPADYATCLLTVMHTLGDMDQTEVEWEDTSSEIGVLLADSGMFQKFDVELSQIADTDYSPFYGLALPLLKHGVLVRPVQLDNVRRFTSYLDDYKILVLSYEFMKPEWPDIHNVLAQWVQNGGILVYVGDGSDPYHQVREWWNQGTRTYHSPAEHLFESVGLEKDPEANVYRVGEGILSYIKEDPRVFTESKDHADGYRKQIQQAIEAKESASLTYKEKNSFVLHRGPYTIVNVLDESVSAESVKLAGSFVDLFTSCLELKDQVEVKPGDNCLLYDLQRRPQGAAYQMIAAASRIEGWETSADSCKFTARGPQGVLASARIYCAQQPEKIQIDGTVHEDWSWDEGSQTVLVQYANDPDGVIVELSS